MDEAVERILAILKYDPNQPRDDAGRWGDGGGSTGGGSGDSGGGGGGGSTSAGATPHMGRSDGTGFKSKEDQDRAAKWVGEADAHLGEIKQKFPGLKKLKVDHVHVHNSDSVPRDAQGRAQAGVDGQYFKGRIDVALSRGRQGEGSGVTLGSFRATSGVKGTFAHEVGHHVEKTVLTKAAQNEWLGVWRQYSGGPTFRSISQYASSSYSEAFAESFAVYTSAGYKSQLPKPVHAFLDKHIAKKGK